VHLLSGGLPEADTKPGYLAIPLGSGQPGARVFGEHAGAKWQVILAQYAKFGGNMLFF
jgi:hypothetical protein